MITPLSELETQQNETFILYANPLTSSIQSFRSPDQGHPGWTETARDPLAVYQAGTYLSLQPEHPSRARQ